MPQASPIDLQAYIRSLPDFPKPGILFRDITLLGNPQAFQFAVRTMADRVRGMGVDLVVAAARGFLLPPRWRWSGVFRFRSASRASSHPSPARFEYGTDTLEIHTDAISPAKVLVVDDLHRRHDRRLLPAGEGWRGGGVSSW